MAGKKSESYFWTSYSDLMTSLFFIMLVLFVLVIVLLHTRMVKIEEERGQYETQLKNIDNLQQSIKQIDSTYFEYNKDFNRFTLKGIQVKFGEGRADISEKMSSEDLDKLYSIGQTVVKFMQDAHKKNAKAEYLVIIEGQASMDNYYDNDALSYRRALSLFDYWTKVKNLAFDNLPCEVIISGSGTRSKFREDDFIYVDGKKIKNEDNQRFVIHIIPKLSEMDSALKTTK